MTTLATVIVSFNTRELLRLAIASFQRSLAEFPLDGRILVVDNQSSDGSAEMVRAHFPEVELLEPGENLGFTRANNLAMRHLGFEKGRMGSAEMVWLLNSDTEVVGDAPRQLVEHLRQHPEVGAVGPRLRYGDGRFQHGAFRFPGLAQVALDLFPAPSRLLESRLNGRYGPAQWEGTRPFEVEMLLGASLMARGETISRVGLMDEGYFMYAEELDWCRQMHAAGWKLHALPTAVVVHHGGQSTQQFRDRMFVSLWRSRLRYYQKWESPAYLWMVRRLLRLGMAWQARRLGSDADSGSRRAAYQEVASL